MQTGKEIGCLLDDYHRLEHFNRMGVKVLDALSMFVRVSDMPDSLSCDQGQYRSVGAYTFHQTGLAPGAPLLCSGQVEPNLDPKAKWPACLGNRRRVIPPS